MHFICNPPCTHAHINSQTIRPRDDVTFRLFLHRGVSPDFEPTPDAFASGGAVRCKQRGLDKISDEVLANRGGGRDFARFFAFPLAENGNWLEPNPIAKRHFVCGDPRLVCATLHV